MPDGGTADLSDAVRANTQKKYGFLGDEWMFQLIPGDGSCMYRGLGFILNGSRNGDDNAKIDRDLRALYAKALEKEVALLQTEPWDFPHDCTVTFDNVPDSISPENVRAAFVRVMKNWGMLPLPKESGPDDAEWGPQRYPGTAVQNGNTTTLTTAIMAHSIEEAIERCETAANALIQNGAGTLHGTGSSFSEATANLQSNGETTETAEAAAKRVLRPRSWGTETDAVNIGILLGILEPIPDLSYNKNANPKVKNRLIITTTKKLRDERPDTKADCDWVLLNVGSHYDVLYRKRADRNNILPIDYARKIQEKGRYMPSVKVFRERAAPAATAQDPVPAAEEEPNPAPAAEEAPAAAPVDPVPAAEEAPAKEADNGGSFSLVGGARAAMISIAGGVANAAKAVKYTAQEAAEAWRDLRGTLGDYEELEQQRDAAKDDADKVTDSSKDLNEFMLDVPRPYLFKNPVGQAVEEITWRAWDRKDALLPEHNWAWDRADREFRDALGEKRNALKAYDTRLKESIANLEESVDERIKEADARYRESLQGP